MRGEGWGKIRPAKDVWAADGGDLCAELLDASLTRLYLNLNAWRCVRVSSIEVPTTRVCGDLGTER